MELKENYHKQFDDKNSLEKRLADMLREMNNLAEVKNDMSSDL